MPFTRPTLQELIERIAADIASRLPGTDARLRRSNLGVLSRVHAGGLHGLYGYLDYLAVQVIPDTAEGEYLDRWATVWGVTRRAAQAAQGNVTFSGVNGALIPAGTIVQRADGVEFVTDVLATIAAGSATVAVTAVVPGAAGNTDAGVTLSLVSPLAGIATAAAVAAGGITGGADTESDALLRAALLRRIQQPPHGGVAFDYIAWALEVAGVTRAWVYPNQYGLGTVGVTFVLDDDPVSLIPNAAKITEVQAYIDARRPVTASVTVFAPIAVPLALTIQLVPNTATVQAAVTAELADLIQREAEPGGAILLSRLDEAISTAAGETDHLLVSPVANVTHGFGEIAVLGIITWA